MENTQKNQNSLVTPKILANQLGIEYKTLCWLKKMASYDISINTESDARKLGYSKILTPYVRLEVPTKSKIRVVYSPCNQLRAIQAMLVQVVLKYMDPGDSSRAYEPGMQLITAGVDMLGGDVVVGLDVKDFFHSIKRSMVKKLFVDEGYPEDTAYIMACLCCVSDKYKFLPQGGIASAAIANRYAARYLDPLVNEVCNSDVPGCFKYIRYSDNIYISLQGDYIGYSLLKKVQASLLANGWRTHKFKVMPKYRRQKLLGMVVNGTAVSIQRDEYRKMCSALFNISKSDASNIVRTLKLLITLGVDTSSLHKLELSLKGKLAYYIQMSEEHRVNRLKDLYSKACYAIDKYRSILPLNLGE